MGSLKGVVSAVWVRWAGREGRKKTGVSKQSSGEKKTREERDGLGLCRDLRAEHFQEEASLSQKQEARTTLQMGGQEMIITGK